MIHAVKRDFHSGFHYHPEWEPRFANGCGIASLVASLFLAYLMIRFG